MNRMNDWKSLKIKHSLIGWKYNNQEIMREAYKGKNLLS